MTRNELLKEIKKNLQEKGICDASEAEFLLALTLKISRGQVRTQDYVPKNLEKQALKNANKRAKGMPLTIIFGTACFYGRDFVVNKNCLAPRPETEELVHLASCNLNKEAKVLDLCTGSGAIAITMSLEFGFGDVTATDISKKALKIARTNAKNLNSDVKFIKSDLFEKLKDQKFDAIISNPPYISEAEFLELDKTVSKFEPKIALVAKDCGLEFYKKIIHDAPKHLNRGGKIFFEVGYKQANEVAKLLENDFEDINIKKDLEGVNRMVFATIKEK